MIKYLQRLKHKRGFTLIEAVVVIAIIGVMLLVVLANIDNVGNKIKAANSTANNFYTAVQSAFTRYMTYPGWLSPELESMSEPVMKYYEIANGCYPRPKTADLLKPEDKYPSPCDLYFEFYAKDGRIKYTHVDYTLEDLLAQTGTTTTDEFARLLQEEVGKRIEFRDGYYYTHVKYASEYQGPGGGGLVDPGHLGVKNYPDTSYVEYAAFAFERLEATKTMFAGRDYQLVNGEVCGVCAPNSVHYYKSTRVGLRGSDLNQPVECD